MDSLFPDKLHFLLFLFYVCLFVNQGILVTASKEPDGSYNYNTTTVVLLTEMVKLLLAMVFYLKEYNWKQLILDIRRSKRVFALYLVPSFLYCLYNNLAFVNLKHYDPTSYFLLLNFRTVATGVVFQFLFKKLLTRRQWIALTVLTAGCIVKQIRLDNLSTLRIELDFSLFFMLLQVFCSCFAGVYNEFLLKDVNSSDVPLMLQNMYMYVDSILMNVGFLIINGQFASAVTPQALASIFQPIVIGIALNNGLAGITTSFFLKKFNSVLKTFAGGIELLITALLSRIFFGVDISPLMLVSIALVSWAMYLYSTNPVVNKAVSTGRHRQIVEEEFDDVDEVFLEDPLEKGQLIDSTGRSGIPFASKV